MNKRGEQPSIGKHEAPSPTDDRKLVDAARRGDRAAFRTLFQRFHRRIYAVALGVVRNPDDALDVVQETFLKAHRNLDRFEGNSSFYTWIYRIAMNLSIDQTRRRKRNRTVELTEPAFADEAVADLRLMPRILGGNPGRALLDREIRERIEQALGELSDNHRAVLVMRELDGLSYEEMAEVMGCSKGTIMSRLFHARRNMQRRLIDLVEASPELRHELFGSDDPGDSGAELGRSKS